MLLWVLVSVLLLWVLVSVLLLWVLVSVLLWVVVTALVHRSNSLLELMHFAVETSVGAGRFQVFSRSSDKGRKIQVDSLTFSSHGGQAL